MSQPPETLHAPLPAPPLKPTTLNSKNRCPEFPSKSCALGFRSKAKKTIAGKFPGRLPKVIGFNERSMAQVHNGSGRDQLIPSVDCEGNLQLQVIAAAGKPVKTINDHSNGHDYC